jgi:hypothetical protein
MLPYEVAYGPKPPSMVLYLLGTSKVQWVEKTLNVRADNICTLKDKLVLAWNEINQQIDQH